jgi:hypothetical protein
MDQIAEMETKQALIERSVSYDFMQDPRKREKLYREEMSTKIAPVFHTRAAFRAD